MRRRASARLPLLETLCVRHGMIGVSPWKSKSWVTELKHQSLVRGSRRGGHADQPERWRESVSCGLNLCWQGWRVVGRFLFVKLCILFVYQLFSCSICHADHKNVLVFKFRSILDQSNCVLQKIHYNCIFCKKN